MAVARAQLARKTERVHLAAQPAHIDPHLLRAVRARVPPEAQDLVHGEVTVGVIDEDRKPSRAELDAAEELLSVLRTYIK